MEYSRLGNTGRGGGINGEKLAGGGAGDDEELETRGITEFRSVSARLNFLAQDSPDVQFPAKEVARFMAKPTYGGLGLLKKVARYLVQREAVVWKYGYQEEEQELRIYVVTGGIANQLQEELFYGGVTVGRVGLLLRGRLHLVRGRRNFMLWWREVFEANGQEQ